MSIGGAISNLIQSIVDVFTGIINFFLSLIQGAFGVVEGVVRSVVELVYGVINFLLSNLVPIAVVAAIVFVYFAATGNGQTVKGKAKRATQ